MKIHLTEGGEGSGNFGHSGRPGEVGGSSDKGSGTVGKPITRAQLRNKIKKVLSGVMDTSVKYGTSTVHAPGKTYAMGYEKYKTSVDIYVSITKTGANVSIRRISNKGEEVAKALEKAGYKVVGKVEPNYVHLELEGNYVE